MYSPIVVRLLEHLYAAGGEISDYDVGDRVNMDAVYEAKTLGLVSLSGGAWSFSEAVTLKRRGYQALGKEPPPTVREWLGDYLRKLQAKIRNR